MELFRAGSWYRAIRIPAIAAVGEQLAVVVVGRHGASDFGPSDLLIRTSSDGGVTWSARRVLERGWFRTVDNPTLVVDGRGRLHLLFQVGYRRLFERVSEDAGVTWGARIERTEVVGGGRIAPGPGRGTRLASGRLVVPVWRPSSTFCIVSDDEGETWVAGSAVWVRGSSEATVEVAGEGVLMSIRQSGVRRVFAWSADGLTWSEPVESELYEPVCHGALTRVGGRLGFVNPDSRAAGRVLPGDRGTRENLTVHWSSDEGRTWDDSEVIDPGPSGYASADGEHLVWEHGMRHRSWYWPAGVRYARLV